MFLLNFHIFMYSARYCFILKYTVLPICCQSNKALLTFMFVFSGKKPDQQQVASQRDFFIISSYPFFPEEDSEMQSPV